MMKRIKNIYLFLIILLIVSCKKDKIADNHPPVAVINYSVNTDTIIIDGSKSYDEDGDLLKFTWSSKTNISINNPNEPVTFFRVKVSDSTYFFTINLSISDGKSDDKEYSTIPNPYFNWVTSWGLGEILYEQKSNDVNYEWYLDQLNTGEFNYNNCGPTVVTMAIKWVNENFDKSPEDARNTYRPEGGWWYTSDITAYLNDYNIDNSTIKLDGIGNIIYELKNDHIVILCLDMYYIRKSEKPEWRVDKFYKTQNTGWGHFIIIKGYKLVDENTYLEAYDPNSWNSRYHDGTLKGENRYYRDVDIDSATNKWWDYAIIVSKTKLVEKSSGVDIPLFHNFGR